MQKPMNHNRYFVPILFAVFVVFGSVFLLQTVITPHTHSSPNSISIDSKTILTNDTALYIYIKQYGPKQTLKHIKDISLLDDTCHPIAHKIGNFAYDIFKEKAFGTCSENCLSGCYHGLTEAYFKDHGTTNLVKSLNSICDPNLTPFNIQQCKHGVGHGLMAWTNYELFDALKGCDLLNGSKENCYTGVFMENVVGTFDKNSFTKKQENPTGHFTKYLKQDPQFPCTIVEDKYKPACYLYQTSWMGQLFHWNFPKISQACQEASPLFKQYCFESMGRDARNASSFNDSPKAVLDLCAKAPEGNMQAACVKGAAKTYFYQPDDQHDALTFCQAVIGNVDKISCYKTIFARALDVLPSKAYVKIMCSEAELPYQSLCFTDVQ